MSCGSNIVNENVSNRGQPHHKTFGNVFRRLRITGQLQAPNLHVEPLPAVRTREYEILRDIERDRRVSNRTLALGYDLSQRTILNVLLDENLHPYHYQRVYCLTP